MAMSPIEERNKLLTERITELAEVVAKPLGLSILEVSFGQEGRRKSLEVTVFRKGGAVSLTDCENVSRQLDKLLEEQSDTDKEISRSLTAEAFMLEVVSPGIDRQLTKQSDFESFLGESVRIKAKEKFEGLGIDFTGTLIAAEGKTFQIADAKPLIEVKKGKAQTKAKVAKGKGKNEKSSQEEGETTWLIDMDKVYKVNLYSDDLAKSNSKPESEIENFSDGEDLT
jgi:ribosome maturation factor RimP